MGSRAWFSGHWTVVVVAIDHPIHKVGQARKGPVAPSVLIYSFLNLKGLMWMDGYVHSN